MTELTAKIRILDDVTVVLVGLHPDHLEYFYNQYAVPAANYFFNPRFKLGQWDGKIRYFHKTGKTYVYLLEEILPQMKRFGYKMTVEDLREITPAPELIDENLFAEYLHRDTGLPIILRDYQYNSVNELINRGSGIIVAATSAGKTFLCAALVQAYGKLGMKTLTIVPSQDLITNTKQDYIHVGLDTGEYSGNSKTLDHTHIVSTWQALQNNPKIIEQFGVVLVDECHGAKGNVLQKILTDHAAKIPYRFGVTGTLPKDPASVLSVKVALGPVRATIYAKELQDRGVLAQLDIDILQLEEDLRKEYNEFCNQGEFIGKPPTYIQFKDGYFPDYASEKSFLHRSKPRIEWIADFLIAKSDTRKGNVLCFVDSIVLGRQLAELIPNAIFVNGKDMKKSSDRQKVYDMFADRDDLIVIATVHIAGTGINIRRIFNLVFIDIGKSFIRVIQAIGRGLRTAEDKSRVNVTDICSDLKYAKRHVKQRMNYYDEAQYPYKKHKLDYLSHTRLEGFE
jgi:superfamily II DNA or RNA helicase